MSDNVKKTLSNQKPKRTSYVKWLAGSVLGSFICLIVAVGLVLANPYWLTSLIEKQLSQQGITTTIKTLSAQFVSTTYRLSTEAAIEVPDYGIQAPEAHLELQLDWWELMKGRPFVHEFSLSDTTVSLSPEQLKLLFKSKSKKKNNLEKYLPRHWQVTNTIVTAYDASLLLSGQGKSDTQAQLRVLDNRSGELKIDYDKADSRLHVVSDHLNLQGFTGVEAILENLSADINTRAWLGSRVTSLLNYQGVSAHIQIDSQTPEAGVRGKNTLATDLGNATMSEDDGLGARVHVQSGDESLTVWLAQQEERITARVYEADLSVVSVLSPILPKKLRFKKAQGKVSGVAVFDLKKGIDNASLTLQDATIFHTFGGLGNIHSTIEFNRENVQFFSRLTHSSVFLPTVFPRGMAPLTGTVEGRFNLEKRELRLHQIDVKNTDVASVKGKALIGLKEKFIDIEARVRDANAAKTRHYLPEQLPLTVRKWLGKAIISGKATDTKVQVKGHYPKFIHRPDSVLKIEADLQDARLHYLDKNPDVLVKKGQLTIDGKKLLVDAPVAEVFTTIKGQRVSAPLKAHAVIGDLLSAVVKVDAQIRRQPMQQLKRIAKLSLAGPVLETIEGIVRADGRLDVGLGLDIGVSKKDHHRLFDINLQSPSINAQLVEFPQVQIKKAKLAMQANQTGLQTLTLHDGKDEQGRKLAIEIERDKATNYLVETTGTVDALSLLSQLKLLSAKDYQLLKKQGLIRGASAAKAQLVFDASGQFKRVEAQSDLQGTSLSVFKLLTKSASTQLPMKLRYDVDKRQLVLSLRRRLALTLGLTKDGGLSGLLVDNLQTKNPYQTGRKQIYYHTQSFDFLRFNQFLDAYTQGQGKTTTWSDFSNDLLDIKIDTVYWSGKKTTPLLAKGRLSNLRIDSPLLSGKIQYQKNQLNAQLAQINVSALLDIFQKKSVNPAGREVTTLSLSKMLPQMQVQVDNVKFKDNTIGSATIRSSIRKGLYSIDQFLVTGKDFFWELSGYEKEESYGMTTHIQSDFKGENIARIATLFKLNPVLDGKFIDVSANLSWPGRAHLLNLQESYGDAKLTAQNVKLTTVGAGVGSLFGLMDIVGILKRITLDFKNLSSSKISFDTVEGSWNIGGGRALTKNMLARGSLIDLKLVGAIDIYRRTFDNLKMEVIPKASNIIPIVGAVAGGVVGGVVGVVVQQIMGDSINQAVGIPYVISGHWDKPKVSSQSEQKQAQEAQEKTQAQKATNTPKLTLEALVNEDDEKHNLELKTSQPKGENTLPDWTIPQKIELESAPSSPLILESLD